MISAEVEDLERLEVAKLESRSDTILRVNALDAEALTASGNSVILLLRILRYRSRVHSEKRAGKVAILL